MLLIWTIILWLGAADDQLFHKTRLITFGCVFVVVALITTRSCVNLVYELKDDNKIERLEDKLSNMPIIIEFINILVLLSVFI